MENNNKPLLSVIVPIYNVEEYLIQCIDSIINQSYKNLQIILVDDGSKGNETNIIDEYASKDNRIKVLHKNNEGLVSARKTGIKKANADYITFVDGDDFLDKDYYEKMMDYIINENPDIVCGAFKRYISKDNIEVCTQKINTKLYTSDSINLVIENMNCYKEVFFENGIIPSVWSKIFKKSLLMEDYMNVPDNITLGEDAAFTFPYILKSKKIVVDNNITGYFYRTNNNQMTKKYDEKVFYGIESLYKYLKPYYIETKNEKVINQLEIYRLYLIKFIIDNTTSIYINPIKIHNSIKKLKKIIINSSLFNLNENDINKFSLPDDLKNKLIYIINNNFIGLEIYCFTRSLR